MPVVPVPAKESSTIQLSVRQWSTTFCITLIGLGKANTRSPRISPTSFAPHSARNSGQKDERRHPLRVFAEESLLAWFPSCRIRRPPNSVILEQGSIARFVRNPAFCRVGLPYVAGSGLLHVIRMEIRAFRRCGLPGQWIGNIGASRIVVGVLVNRCGRCVGQGSKRFPSIFRRQIMYS